MNYFKGSVIEAIAEAKKEKGVFIVFIYDKGELSESARNDLKKEELTRTLSSLKYVAIEIENGSKDAIQFAQIYPLVVVPSLFFISPQSGVPLEVIAGNIDYKVLADKVKNINTSLYKDDCALLVETNNVPSSKSEESTEKEAVKKIDQVEESVEPGPLDPTEPPGSQASNYAATALADIETSSASEQVNPPSVEERVEKAKELINQLQDTKAQQEIEEEKKKEIERRRSSSEVAKARQKREEQERLDISRQRKKDKEEERLARERVKAQIAADRAERQARLSLLKGEEPSAPSRPVQEASLQINNQEPSIQNRNETTRIKFRFPDNSSELSQFRSEATLLEVRHYLIENGKVPFSKFKMVGTLPPRTFTDADMPTTLEHLGLTPSAIIIIKPMTSGTSSSIEPLRKSIILFVWSMFSPLLVLYQYLRGFLGLGNKEEARKEPSSDEEDVPSSSSKRPRTEASFTTRNRPKTAYGKREESGSFLRREGNVHRMNQRGDEDDDDENNTWNGNSTQQM